jgi:hypothetical protein
MSSEFSILESMPYLELGVAARVKEWASFTALALMDDWQRVRRNANLPGTASAILHDQSAVGCASRGSRGLEALDGACSVWS